MSRQPVYTNLDLAIGPGRAGLYPVSILGSPAGETREPTQVAIDPTGEPLRSWLAQLSAGTIGSDDLTALGRRLADFLLPAGPVRDLCQRSLGMADASKMGLRLRLRIGPSELAALPWEFVYDENAADFFTVNPRTVVVRYHSQPVTPYTIVSYAPVPILLFICNPPETPPLDIVQETTSLLRALSPLLNEGRVTVDILCTGPSEERQKIVGLAEEQEGVVLSGLASVEALRDTLRQGHRVLHYIGHGLFDETLGGALVLTGSEGGLTLVSAQTLQRELRGSSAAVVVLNACASATEDTTRSFMGLAPNLIRAGVPAVVAMQYAFRDKSATAFSRALYRALADGWPLDAAVTEGRKAISAAADGQTADWGIPVLFMRSPDGVIWTAQYASRTAIVTQADKWRQQALDVAGAARQARTTETEILAQGVSNYAQRLKTLAGKEGEAAAGNPYKGLLEYRLSDAELFFGRSQAIRELLERIQRTPLTVLHAESGAGKTSLLQAGIAPLLITAGHLPIYLRPYDVSPTAALKRAFLPDPTAVPGVAGTNLRDFLGRVSEVLGPQTQIYVFVDQFEEFFIQLPEPSQQEFINGLGECLDDASLNVRWVLSLRNEFFSNLANFRPRIRNPFENEYRLNHLTRAEAREVIIEPAVRRGLSIAPDVVEMLLDNLGGSVIVPPQLQLVCLALYQELPAGETVITQELYARVGGAAGILRGHLERVLQRDLPPGQRIVAHFLLEALLTSEVRRIRRTRAELAAELADRGVARPVVEATLAQLVDSRLLRAEDSGQPGAELIYELAHDYLAEQIELSPEVKGRKAAQELLSRELLNWQLYGALMHDRTLEVIGVQRDVLQIDEAAGELLARSAFDAGVDTAYWLGRISSDRARQILQEGLGQPESELRARAADHLGPYCDSAAEERLVQMAREDAEPTVRMIALRTLSQLAPGHAQEVLLSELVHAEPDRRVAAAQALNRYPNPEVTRALFDCIAREMDERVLGAVLGTLSAEAFASLRDRWRPLLRADTSQRAILHSWLRRLPDVPFNVRGRIFPAHMRARLHREARQRPAWLALRGVAVIIMLYLLLAWRVSWPPFGLRWERFPGAPQVNFSSVDVVDGWVYAGSTDYGVVRREPQGRWSGWLRAGLPVSEPRQSIFGRVVDPQANIPLVASIAADPMHPERVYIYLMKHGLFASMNAGQTWVPIGASVVPTDADFSALDAFDGTVIFVTGGSGVFGSGDAGQTWRQLSGENGLPAAEFTAVRFAQDGVPYVGGRDGLYRGRGRFPWQWENVPGVPATFYFDFGPGGRIYVATSQVMLKELGEARPNTLACFSQTTGSLRVLSIFENDAVTAVAADPLRPDSFYVGTIKTTYRLSCAPETRGLDPGVLAVWLLSSLRNLDVGVGGFSPIQQADGTIGLIQAKGGGLYIPTR